jgi:endoglucanase Acf2
MGIRPSHCEGAPHGRDGTPYAELLRQHAGSYPVSAGMEMSVKGDVGHVDWNWKIKVLQGWERVPLMQLAWPVHLPLLSSKVRKAADANVVTPFHDIRGPAVAVLGDSWRLTYRLFPDVGLRAPRPVSEKLRSELLQALRGPAYGGEGSLWNGSLPDCDFDLPLNYQLGVGDTYFVGKMLARLARLVQIADELGETHEPYFEAMLRRLAERLEVWLKADAAAPFVYDTSWGGLVSCGCNYDDCYGKCSPRCSNPVEPA